MQDKQQGIVIVQNLVAHMNSRSRHPRTGSNGGEVHSACIGGAIADGNTVSRATLDARLYLNKHDAEIFFDSLDDSLQFVSMTNVNDLIVILIG